ncbi:hypothetical protein EAF04_001102 [Stromatinia cepivora]|nr:hypothetical protein EAF04_001102 [Stromatinia cepivora]
MLFHAFMLWLCLYVLNSNSCPHPSNSVAVTPSTSAVNSTRNDLRDVKTPDVLCWYGFVPPDTNSCTYVYEVVEEINAFNFYVCNKSVDPAAKALVQLGLEYEFDNVIDTGKTPLANNISVQVTKNRFDGSLLAFVWYIDRYLPITSATKVFDGRTIGWAAFDTCVVHLVCKFCSFISQSLHADKLTSSALG